MNQTTVNGSTTLFCDYYKQWITVYKEGAIRPVTMNKYNMAHHWLEKLAPDLTLGDLDRFAYVVQIWVQTFGETAQAERFSHAGTGGEHTDPPCIL